MGVVQCPKGHFYDDRKNTSCPYCEQPDQDESVTVQFREDMIIHDAIKLQVQDVIHYEGDFDDQKTQRFFAKEKGNDFVTGWLVCVSGPEKGRSYSLSDGFNRISRGKSVDTAICIEEDYYISRGCHCAVVYEYNKNTFYIVAQEGNLVYLNDKFLENPEVLQTGDILKIGKSEFEFIAFCRGDRKWGK